MPCLSRRAVVLFGGWLALAVATDAAAISGHVYGLVENATTSAPVTHGSVALTINGVPWGSPAAIDGGGNFDFGTVTWAAGTTVSCQLQTSGTGYIDGGVTLPLSSGGSLDAVINLQPGSSISGTVMDAANQPIAAGSVRIFDAGGTLLGSASVDGQGVYRYGGLVAGSYYAETDEFPYYVDQLWNAVGCAKDDCVATSGTAIALPDDSSYAVANFRLDADSIFFDTFD